MSEAALLTGSNATRLGVSSHQAWSRWALLVIVLVSTGATLAAMRRTSTTFDEIVLIAGGARGYETGRFDLAPEHPPLMQYIYGLPVYLDGVEYPVEPEAPPPGFGYRYSYAQHFFWRVGNDGERIAYLGRIMSATCVLALVFAVFFFTRNRYGDVAAVLAAALVAFLPDALAHGGVAYNDTPLALLFFCAVWAVDKAVRAPDFRRGVIAGWIVALALGVKHSAVALGPVALLLVACEALIRRGDGAWWKALGVSVAAALVVAYLTLVAVYRGDFTLAEYLYGLDFTFRHTSQGHGAPGYLFGSFSTTGWWYFFPVAFLLKTPAALHVLMMLAVSGYTYAGRPTVSGLLGSPLRPIFVGGAVFGVALLTSNLVIGFRYALPVLPLLCVMVAVGVAQLRERVGRRLRLGIVALVVLYAGSSLSFYPHFLAYTSEYLPARDHGHEVLLDSSLDWGQGLIELRRFMEDEGIDRVYLSYFGSALPEGYGIDYIPLASFFPLPLRPAGSAAAPDPEFAVISATNLHGVYLPGDPFSKLREVEPYRILGHSLFVYRIGERDEPSE